MPAELNAVVRSYGEDIPPVRPQQSCDRLGHGIRILALRKPLHDKVVPAPLAQGQNRALLAFPKYQVHLPVSEPLPVRFSRPFVDAYPVRDVRGHCRTLPLLVPPVLHPVAAVATQLSAVVITYHLIYSLMRYAYPLLLQPAGYLTR